jgi:carboxyl-terminal processing protease
VKIWNGTPQTKLAVIGVLMVLALLPSISGCTTGPENPLTRVLRVVGTGHSLSPSAQREFKRFDVTYHKFATVSDQDRLDYFGFAFKRLRTSYVRPVSDKDLIDAAIKGVIDAKAEPGTMKPDAVVEAALDAMTASLDPHTAFLNSEEFRESFVHTKGEFGGLGIEVTMEEGFVKVVSPIEDTPAARADLRSGDLITHVDSEPIKGKTLREAVRKMRGAPGTEILLKVRRKNTEDFDVTLVRAVIKVRAVRWQLEDRIGYIRVSRFSERMEGGVIKAIAAIRAKLGRKPDGLVLDLRNNPGGLLDQSVILADTFLNDGEIVSIRGRRANDVRSFGAEKGDLADGLPMVVLINGGAASASEIVASALKVHKRATIMGTRSFGKGSVQTIIPLPVDGALKMTTALYYGPDGQTIQAQGVVPDIRIEPEEEVKHRKESDLPGAFSAKNGADSSGQSRVHITSCPEIGERKDRELGCALEFLKSGSKRKFLAAYGNRQQM